MGARVDWRLAATQETTERTDGRISGTVIGLGLGLPRVRFSKGYGLLGLRFGRVRVS